MKEPPGKKFRKQIIEVYLSIVLGDIIIVIIIYYPLGKMNEFLVQQGMSSWCCLLVLPL